jgi:hypothetical protein
VLCRFRLDVSNGLAAILDVVDDHVMILCDASTALAVPV